MSRPRLCLSLALLLCLPPSVFACLWDRDTPDSEAKGMPEVVDVLTGRFPRNPPLYYEMRLERVSAKLKDHPEDLEAYDDAGVACDRLGRGDEAVAWMEEKLKRLETLAPSKPEVKEHRYRYHANLGTFLVHRWARQGADRSKLDQVKAARDEIAKALEINPAAHFGREKYQLITLDWLLNPPEVLRYQPLPNILGWSEQFPLETDNPKEADDAVRGFAGLVALGNAWESVDVFNTLSVALQHDTLGFENTRQGGRNSLALYAWLRAQELVDAGKSSMLPNAPKGEVLKQNLSGPDFANRANESTGVFDHLRQEADAWQAARESYLMNGLKAGRHPDTDPGFWSGYREAPRPRLPTISQTDAYQADMASRQRRAGAVVILVPTLCIAAIVLVPRVLRARARWRHSRTA
ncbi:hypothetical protein [Singulisphaera sp. PoT]|uniref:hypothetical protein n=1 Tax=Singulisphaera sp. PoT TaxID=3411797 RepID=UPI003BF58AD5